jgi:hypothetical protein
MWLAFEDSVSRVQETGIQETGIQETGIQETGILSLTTKR